MIKNNIYTFQCENNTSSNLKTKIILNKTEFLDIRVPYSWYNINTFNNTFTLTDSSDNDYVITLIQGQYLTGTLISAQIQTQMNACASTDVYAVSYDTMTCKYTISETDGPDDFEITWNDNYILRNMLGFSVNLSAAATYTSTGIASSRFCEEIFIKIEEFQYQSKNKCKSLLTQINENYYNYHGYVSNVNFGNHVEIKFNYTGYIPDINDIQRGERINHLTISVYNEYGLLIPLNHKKILIRFKNL